MNVIEEQLPIRRRKMQYPKDFTPGTIRPTKCKIQSEKVTRYCKNEQELFSSSLKLDTQPQIKEEGVQTFLEQNNDANEEKPLQKIKHVEPQIQPSKFYPQLQNMENQDIREPTETDQVSPICNKKPQYSQIPLSYQSPFDFKTQTASSISHKKINSVSNRLIEGVRRQYSYNKSQKQFPRLPILGLGDHSDGPNGSTRLKKKHSTHQSFRLSQKKDPFLPSTKQSYHATPEKFMIFDKSKIDSLNLQISTMLQRRKAKLSPPRNTTNTQNQEENPEQFRFNESYHISKVNNTTRTPSYFRKSKNHFGKRLQMSQYHTSQLRDIQISYKTSLIFLKDLLNQKNQRTFINLSIKIPQILQTPIIDSTNSRVQIYEIGLEIFKQLGIAIDSLVVKKYSNCVLLLNRNIAILWHYDGRIYFGGWQNQYLDEGVRHGLGLEWYPHKYAYYGEFSKNKRQGLGVMRQANGQVYVGLWVEGKHSGFGRTYLPNGEIISSHKTNKSNYWEQQYEVEPSRFFMQC